MKKRIIILGAIVIALLAGASLFYFFYLGSPSRQVLAHVNGETITVERFKRELANVESPLREIYGEEPDEFLEGMIVKAILLQEAKKQDISPPPKTYKDNAKDSLSPEDALIAELLKKKFPSLPAATREEIKQFYSLLKDRMGGKPLDQVAPMIEQLIIEGKHRERVEQFFKEVRGAANVEVDQILLKKIAVKAPETNSEEDLKKSLASGKPVLVDFGANSCVPCRQMRPILKEVSKEYSAKAQVIVIDIYKYQNLAKEYQIVLIPTLVFFDSKGKEVFRHVGILEKEKIVAKLQEVGIGT
jgi:thioredoxin 1